MIKTICVIGAGTMGSGIAQVAAQSGFETLLFDINESGLQNASASIQKSLQYLVTKEKLAAAESTQIFNRIQFTTSINQCKVDVFIEAIIEKLEAKVNIFNQLATFNTDSAIFASNTSSLSITAIQQEIKNPERVVGMHFFNPAQIMKLVEVVKGQSTSDVVAKTIYELCLQMQKTPVMCKDAPGFIVNRVARHFYLETMKMVEQGNVSIADADAIMEANGFKMGPFKLMDLIGMDINLKVSQSLYEAFDKEPRFKPSTLQMEKVAKGQLGKKTGKGFYDYTNLLPNA